MTDTTEPPRRRPASGGKRDASRGDRAPPRAERQGSAERPGGTDRQRRTEPPPASDDARVAKVMARAGLCSRRDAETWIAAGRVAVNGRIIDSPALNVGPRDRITVDGAALPEREPTRLFLFHKPRGLVTTARDPEGRPTIFENLPEGLPRVVSVGRLDINTEGLMLLTNDGGLARVLELPSTGWLRRYRVRANGTIDQARLDALKGGVTIDGVEYLGIEAVLDRQQGANVWLTMGLREGKNREVKRVLESLGLAVTRLIRVSFGPFQLGELVAGAAESVPTRILRDQLGPDLAAKAGVSFPDGATASAGSRGEPRPRAHVSALRTQRDEAAEGPRRRIERAATADRKGRAVAIERVVPVGGRPSREDTGPGRNARRFSAENRAAAPSRRPARERPADGGRTAREANDDRSRARTPSLHGPEPSARAGRGGGGERSSSGDAARPSRTDRFGERPRRDDAPRGSRTRDDHGMGRAGPSRKDSGKPGGRPGGFGSERPATGRNRPEEAGNRERPGRGAAKSGFTGGDRPRAGSGPAKGRPAGGPSGRPSGGGRPRGRS